MSNKEMVPFLWFNRNAIVAWKSVHLANSYFPYSDYRWLLQTDSLLGFLVHFLIPPFHFGRGLNGFICCKRTLTARLSNHLITRSSMPSISQVFTSDFLPHEFIVLLPFNVLERTVPTTAILCSINVDTRGTPVYQLSMKSLYQLLHCIFDIRYITILAEAWGRRWPSHLWIVPMWIWKLNIWLSGLMRTCNLYPHFLGF